LGYVNSFLDMIKVSIVVPVFNVDKYLDRCLESLVAQTLRDIEIILVDDGSTDSSPDLCDEWVKKDQRIKTIHKKNEGLGLTRNAGIAVASGEYVAYCDSDDYVESTMYESMYNYSKQNNLDVCYCNFARDTDGIISYPTNSPQDNLLFTKENEARDFLMEMIGPFPDYSSDVKYMVSSCMAIYSNKILQDYNVRFESERIVLSEDTIYNMDFLYHTTRVGYLKTPFYIYRYNPSSLSRTYTHKKYETFKNLLLVMGDRLSERYEKNVYEIHYLRYIFYIYRLVVKYESIRNIDGKRRNTILKRISEPILDDVYKKYPYKKFRFLKRCFFYFMKKKFVIPLILMSLIENKQRKVI